MAYDTSGLSGYALYYAQAANKGMSDAEANRYATQMMGGSGLRRTDVDQILKDTGSTSESQGIRYDPNTGYAINDYESGGGGGNNENNNNSFDFSSFFGQMMNNVPTFNAPSRAELEGWARAYADTQTNPLISAIQARLIKERAAQENARGEVEAAYGGLPAQYQARLDEAREYALENAIARGMGRTGVVNWETEKRTTPILQEQAQADREKASKLAAIANAIAAAEASAAESVQAAEANRAALEASKLADLQQWSAGMQANQGLNSFNQILSMADMYNSSQNNTSTLLMQLLPLLMGGS